MKALLLQVAFVVVAFTLITVATKTGKPDESKLSISQKQLC